MTDDAIYGHSLPSHESHEWETLRAHAERVGAAARQRALRFDAGEVASTLGLLHDLGKAKPAFQRYLRDEGPQVGHSAEGARRLASMGGFAKILSAAVAGHHGRLPEPDDLARRIAAAEDVPLPSWLDLPPIKLPGHLTNGGKETLAYRFQFIVRMLYGALTDADDRETAAFYAEAQGRSLPKRRDKLTKEMCAAFSAHMRGMSGAGLVNALRRDVLSHARGVAGAPQGLFTLTVPTGGGKTLTSLGFALDHALRHGLDRLIYVIPYTSIIEQTADEMRKVFRDLGEDVVLEHHANADWDGEDESEAEQLQVMGASWDVPIVVTTAVQFFESLHAARKKRCRKLPSLAGAVIVLDEAQTLPLKLLRPCLAALKELMEGYGATVVLSTATQPALTREEGFPDCAEALHGAREIAPNPDDLFRRLRRVTVRDVGPMDDHALAARMRAEEQALLIVDNRMQAATLFAAIRCVPGACHLSTLMTPDHRRQALAEVRARLKGGDPVRLVATSLVEAGVDVDFPLVLRAAAGIDSIAQAAGRCNREGRMDELGRVEVFRSQHPAPPAVEQFASIGRAVLDEGHDDPIGRDAVAAYFRRLWEAYGVDALDCALVGEGVQHRGILAAIRAWGPACHFPTLEAAFRIIPDGGPAVAVVGGPHGIAWDDLHRDAIRFGPPGAVAKALRPHTATLPHALWRSLRDAGAVSFFEAGRFGEQFPYVLGDTHYDDRAGIKVEDPSILMQTIL